MIACTRADWTGLLRAFVLVDGVVLLFVLIAVLAGAHH